MKREDFDIEMDEGQTAKSLEEQFARELEERKSTARNGYRYSFAAYFVFLLIMATVTDYLRINVMDGLFLGIMGSSSVFFSVQFGMLFAISYYFKEGTQAIVMEPIECVTEFLPFSKERYKEYVKGKLLPWCRRIFFGSFLIHFLGLHIFTRENAFPHFIWEYPMNWGRYVLDILVILLFSGLISYLPLICLNNINKRRLYQGQRKAANKKVRKGKSKKWRSFAVICSGISILSVILFFILHFLIYYPYFNGAEAANPILLYVPMSGGWPSILMMAGIAGGVIDCTEGVSIKDLKKMLIIMLLTIVLFLVADGNGIVFYEDSLVVRQLSLRTEYSLDDVEEYELHVKKRLGLKKETILSMSMENGKQVNMNLSRSELNDAAYEAYGPTGGWGFALNYVKRLDEMGINGYVRDKGMIEEEIESIYDDYEIKQCLEQICRLSEE